RRSGGRGRRLRRRHPGARGRGRREVHRLLARSAHTGDRGAGSSAMTVSVHVSQSAKAAVDEIVHRLVADLVASRVTAGDPTLWGPDAEAEASVRLGWVEAVSVSRPLVAEIVALRDELAARGVDRVVLAGMGGSSLAPEVIASTAGVALTVLDSTSPAQVLAALDGDLSRTVLVVSSKSGTTVETDAQRRAFEAAFGDLGLD